MCILTCALYERCMHTSTARTSSTEYIVTFLLLVAMAAVVMMVVDGTRVPMIVPNQFTMLENRRIGSCALCTV